MSRPSTYFAAFLGSLLAAFAASALAQDLVYEATNPPLEITFAVDGGHYSGVVNPGSLFLQADISNAPVATSPVPTDSLRCSWAFTKTTSSSLSRR